MTAWAASSKLQLHLSRCIWKCFFYVCSSFSLSHCSSQRVYHDTGRFQVKIALNVGCTCLKCHALLQSFKCVDCIAQNFSTIYMLCQARNPQSPPLFTTLIWNKSFLDWLPPFLRRVRLIWAQCGGCLLCAQVGSATKEPSNTVWPHFHSLLEQIGHRVKSLGHCYPLRKREKFVWIFVFCHGIITSA